MASDASVDDALKRCAEEPIHIPGSIQPYGVLVGVDEEGLVSHVSANVGSLLRGSPERLLGQPLANPLGVDLAEKLLAQAAGPLDLQRETVPTALGSRVVDVRIHRASPQARVIEFEPVDADALSIGMRRLSELQQETTGLLQVKTVEQVCDDVAAHVSAVTGFARVMVYRFDRDGHGTVVAERLLDERMASYLGHRFPGSDIPPQARALYVKSLLRQIPSADYEPSPLLARPDAEAPLDLSLAVLRSVSPIHLEYLQNMGVRASMSVSLVHGTDLWGLVACHHPSPRKLEAWQRVQCESMGLFAGARLIQLEAAADADTVHQQRHLVGQVATALRDAAAVVPALEQSAEALLTAMDACGVMVVHRDGQFTEGDAPGPEILRHLLVTTLAEDDGGGVAVNSFSEAYGLSHPVVAGAYGRVLDGSAGEFVLWFRKEHRRTETWAGPPHKPVDASTGRINPRHSFEAWKEQIAGRSLPITDVHRRVSEQLAALLSTWLPVLRERAKAEADVARLQEQAHELKRFAHVASHDLKAPLRVIRSFGEILQEDSALEGESKAYVDLMVDASTRLTNMVNGVLEFSSIRPEEVSLAPVALPQVVEGAATALGLDTSPSVKLDVGPLPTVQGDFGLLVRLFQNLLDNADKYRDSDDLRVEVVADSEANGWRVSVLDDGLGLKEGEEQRIFEMFERGSVAGRVTGSGSGLAVCARIMEAHGGTISAHRRIEGGAEFRLWFPAS